MIFVPPPPEPLAERHAPLIKRREQVIKAALCGGHDYDSAREWAERCIPSALFDEHAQRYESEMEVYRDFTKRFEEWRKFRRVQPLPPQRYWWEFWK